MKLRNRVEKETVRGNIIGVIFVVFFILLIGGILVNTVLLELIPVLFVIILIAPYIFLK